VSEVLFIPVDIRSTVPATFDGKFRYPMRERSHAKSPSSPAGQGSIDPAVPFSNLSVVIFGAQHDFERPDAAHEASEVLSGARSGDYTKRRLKLTKDRRLARRKAHVARQYELAPNTTNTTLDLRNADEPTGAQLTEQLTDRLFAAEARRSLPVLFDSGHIHVGNEILRVGGLEHEHLDGIIGLR